MMPQADDLRYFAAIVETLNLSRAAERLGVVQSTLSQSLKRLEDVCDAKLFVRLRHGLEITREGRLLYERSKTLLEQWAKVADEISKTSQLLKGRYTLGCHPSVALYSLGAFLPELLKENPDLEVALEHGLSREISEKVISFQTDFGIVINPVRHDDLVLRKLAVDDVTFWICKGGDSETLILEPSLNQTQSLLRKIPKKQMQNFRRHVTTSNLEVAAELVRLGVGVGILPERVASRVEGIQLFDQEMPKFRDELYFIYRKDAQNTEAAKRFISAVSQAKI